jgi:uridine kinase
MIEELCKNHIKPAQWRGGREEEAHEIIARALLRKFKGYKRPVIIAVGGPGGTGKTIFAARLAAALEDAAVLPLDDYKTTRKARAKKKIFGPHPKANKIALIRSHLERLRLGKDIQKPLYCRVLGRSHRRQTFAPARFVIIEGEIATYSVFHAYVDFSIFIDSHWKTQLNTRIQRDIKERGYSPQKAIASFLYSNLHEFSEYGAESKQWADIHIHCDSEYRLVIDAVCSKSAQFLIDEVSSGLVGMFLPAAKEKSGCC